MQKNKQPRHDEHQTERFEGVSYWIFLGDVIGWYGYGLPSASEVDWSGSVRCDCGVCKGG
ncbi:hypothetical protein KCV26_05275 [Petrimonas sulfuriphila]|uniref:hypothetical protein n=1 Tax=Petrimonas sulfuriphila TaxID=285070 RepID=UPI00324CA026